jgi:glutamyl-tRNA synthetase
VRTFEDHVQGRHAWNLHANPGDFLVATKGGWPSYQLAVVVDDARQSVDRIVRGDDLLSSVARQDLIYQHLGLHARPEHWHFPLVVGPDGRRLAKRHGDTRISSFRERGVPAERIVGLIASWCGITPRYHPRPLAADEFLRGLDWKAVPLEAIQCGLGDAIWLENR